MDSMNATVTWATVGAPSTVIVASGDFARKQRSTLWWFRFGLGLVAAGSALQAIGAWLS